MSVWCLTQGNYLEVGWSSVLAKGGAGVLHEPLSFHDATYRDGGGRVRRVDAEQEAWPWDLTLETLRGNLSQLLQRRALDVSSPTLLHEHVWNVAMAYRKLMHAAKVRQQVAAGQTVAVWALDTPAEVPLEEVERWIEPHRDAWAVHVGKVWYSPRTVGEELRRRRDQGRRVLEAPWPLQDRPFDRGHLGYTHEQHLRYMEVVFGGALEAYQHFVKTQFPTLAHRLRLAVTLPARFTVTVIPAELTDHNARPIWSWYAEPLPVGHSSVVDVALGQQGAEPEVEYAALHALARERRPEAAEWFTLPREYRALTFSTGRPVAQLAYEWLWQDLRDVNWVEGLPGVDG